MQLKLFSLILIGTLALFFVACDDSESGNNANNTNNVNNVNNVNNTNNANNVNNVNNANNVNNITREAFELTINMHDPGTQKMNLRDKTAGGNLESCDFGFVDDEINGPRILLCPGTTGYNAGNTVDFYDVTTAPSDVTYETDGTNTYVIGYSWVSGGSCSAGWECNGNIYILHLQDGSYAKIEVVHAQGGTVTVLAFRDPAGGADLTCTEPSL